MNDREKSFQNKIKYLTEEIKELENQRDNLRQTLKINKELLNNVLMGTYPDEEEAFIQMDEAQEVTMEELDRLELIRGELAAKVLLLEQINYEL